MYFLVEGYNTCLLIASISSNKLKLCRNIRGQSNKLNNTSEMQLAKCRLWDTLQNKLSAFFKTKQKTERGKKYMYVAVLEDIKRNSRDFVI